MYSQIDALVEKYETELQQKLGILTGSSKVLDQMESTIKLAANEMQSNLPEIVRTNFESAIDAALNANSASELSSALQKAQAEIDKIEGNPYTIGIFYTNKRIKVIDLSAIAEWKRPSAFDLSPEAIECRESWFFLRQFIDIISKVNSLFLLHEYKRHNISI